MRIFSEKPVQNYNFFCYLANNWEKNLSVLVKFIAFLNNLKVNSIMK